ncbi:hypothetical protein KY326_04720 [Candidatus Woesearchaeota archaeon]|nr:hypothetical protein [Candidatus Woesearchaeota archaeon]
MAKKDQTEPKGDDERQKIEDAVRKAQDGAEISHSTLFMEKGPRIQLQHIMKLCADSALKELQTISAFGLSEARKEEAQKDIEGIKDDADANFQEVPDMLTGQERDKKVEYITQYSGYLLDQCKDIDGVLTGARIVCQGGGVDHHKALFMAHYQSAMDQIFGFQDEKGHDKKGLYLNEEDSGAYRQKLETLKGEVDQKYKTMDSDKYAVFVIDMNSEIDKILQEARDLRKQAVNGKARERFDVSEEEVMGISEVFASDPESLTTEGSEDEGVEEIVEEGEEVITSADEIRVLEEEAERMQKLQEADRQDKIFKYSFEANFNAKMGDYRKATVYFQVVEKLDPKNETATAFLESEEAKPYLGMTLDQLKAAEDEEKKSAEEDFNDKFERGFKLATDANFYRNMKDYEKATVAYQALLAINPEHADAKAFLESDEAKPYLADAKPAEEYDRSLFETQIFGEEPDKDSPFADLDIILGSPAEGEEPEAPAE